MTDLSSEKIEEMLQNQPEIPEIPEGKEEKEVRGSLWRLICHAMSP